MCIRDRAGTTIHDHTSNKTYNVLHSFANNYRDANTDSVKNVIETIDRLYNESADILVDSENLYLGIA